MNRLTRKMGALAIITPLCTTGNHAKGADVSDDRVRVALQRGVDYVFMHQKDAGWEGNPKSYFAPIDSGITALIRRL